MKLIIILITFGIQSLAFSKIEKINVYKAERRMDFIEDGKIVKSFDIRLAFAHNNPFFKMAPKRLRGDHRTPEGNYKISKKRQNTAYRKSLLINYPNNKDLRWGAKNGYKKHELGDLILIHGERRSPTPEILRYARSMGIEDDSVDQWLKQSFYPFYDWTNGCIAVNEDEMNEIFKVINVGTPIVIKESILNE